MLPGLVAGPSPTPSGEPGFPISYSELLEQTLTVTPLALQGHSAASPPLRRAGGAVASARCRRGAPGRAGPPRKDEGAVGAMFSHPLIPGGSVHLNSAAGTRGYQAKVTGDMVACA